MPKAQQDRLSLLKDQILKARDDYYNEHPTVEDHVYDGWIQEYTAILVANGIDPETDAMLAAVGAAPQGTKVTHQTFMGSLDNCMDEEAFRAFDKRVGGPYYCNPKFDGASIALYYKNGKLSLAVTRGDGIVGDDITDNVRKFKNLPEQAGYFTGAVRGEAILFIKEWEQIDPDAEQNPRNLGNGIIQRSDGTQSELIRFLAFDIAPQGLELKTELEKEELLTSLGFDVRMGVICQDGDSVVRAHALLSQNRKTLPFWIDGMVVKANDLARQKSLGISNKRPKGQTAFKFTAERMKTKLEEVIWTVGHTGAQIPTGRVTPVRLGGTTVENALLCNMNRLSEHAGLYRYELSGTLTGLIRMRGPITQNDSHMYMTAAQVEKEFNDLLAFFKYIYEICGVKGYWYRLSLPDFTKGKYAGDPEKWKAASETIRKCLEQSGEPFVAVEDEAAFYGPKLDVQIKNVHGKEDSIATVQIDILVPERMGITYINDKGEKEYPVVIHKSIMGAFERFIGFMIEQTAGWFPFWMAPEQLRILTINDSVGEYVAEIKEILTGIVLMKPVKYNELRFTVDDRNESLGKKIRAATAMKIPVQLIVGPKDQEAREVSVRTRNGEEKVALDSLADYLRNLP